MGILRVSLGCSKIAPREPFKQVSKGFEEDIMDLSSIFNGSVNVVSIYIVFQIAIKEGLMKLSMCFIKA